MNNNYNLLNEIRQLDEESLLNIDFGKYKNNPEILLELLQILKGNSQSSKKRIDETKELLLNEKEKYIKSTNDYKRLFDTMAQGVVYQDKDGNVISANKAALDMLGVTWEQMVGRTSFDPRWKSIYENGKICPGNEHPAMISLRTGKPVNDFLMGVFHPKLNEYKWLLINSVPEFLVGDNKPYQVYATLSDITEIKKYENQLKIVSNRLNEASKISKLGYYELDIEKGEWISTKTLDDIFGIDQHSARNIKTWINMVSPSCRQEMFHYFQDYVLYKKNKFDKEYKIINQIDQTERWVHGLGYLEYNENGNPIKMLGTIQDITERKFTEETIKETEISYKQLFDNITDAIYIEDETGKFLDVNEGAVKMYGYDKEFFIGKSLIDISAPDKNDYLDFGIKIKKAFEGEPQYFEFWGIRKNGEIFPKEVHITKAKYFGKDVVLAIARDVTEKRKALDAIIESEEKYRSLFEELNSGFALHEIICDDYNNPIDYKFITVNPAWESLTGLKAEQIINKTVLDILPNTEKYWIDNYGKVALTGQPMQFENYSHELDKYFEVKAYSPKQNQFAVLVSDITHRKQIENNLLKTEERLRYAIEATADGIWDWEIQTNKVYWSPRCFEMIGYENNEFVVIWEKWFELIHPEDSKRAWESIQNQIKNNNGMFSEEFRFISKKGNVVWILSKGKAVEYDDERKIKRLVGTHSDITEKVRLTNSLKEREARYKALLQANPDLMFLIKKDGTFVEVQARNPEELLLPIESIVGKNINEIFTENLSTLFISAINKTLETGIEEKVEYLLNINNSNRYYESRVVKCEEELALSLIRDITDEKIAHLALAESEERFRYLLEDMAMISVQGYYSNGTVHYWNKASEKLYGYSKEEAMGNNLFNLIIPEEIKEDVRNAVKNSFDKGINIPASEITLKRKDGSNVVVYSSHILINRTGYPSEMYCVDIDLSKIKLAEQSLKESELKHRALYENAPLSYQSLDENGCFFDVNPMWLKTLGYEKEEVIGKCFSEFLHPDYKKHFKVNFQVLKNLGCISNVLFQLRKKTGEYIFVSYETSVGYNSKGEFSQTHCIFKDLTEQKEAERMLQESTKTLTDLINRMPTGIFVYQYEDPDQLILLEGNPEAERLTGLKINEIKGLEFNSIFPRAKKEGITDEYINVCKTGLTFETENLFYSDEKITGAFRIRAFSLPSYKLVVAFENITEKIKAQVELKEREALLRTFIDSIPFEVWARDKNGIGILENKILLEHFGSILGKSVDDTVFSNDDKKIWKFNNERVFRGEKIVEDCVYIVNNEKRVYNQIIVPIYSDDEIKGIAGINMDVTDRKQAEKKLIESEEKFRSYIENSPYGILVVDENGKYLETNETVTKLTGFSQEELLQMSIQDIVSEKYQDEARLHFLKVINEGYAFGEIILKHKTKNEIWFSVTAVKLSENRFLGFIQDISERKQNEQEILDQMKEINKFNKLMIGREERMIELKREINKMLEKEGKPKKYDIE